MHKKITIIATPPLLARWILRRWRASGRNPGSAGKSGDTPAVPAAKDSSAATTGGAYNTEQVVT